MPISGINKDGTVKIYSKTTGQVVDVKPEELAKYNPGLVGEYQQMTTMRDAVKSGQLKTSDIPAAQKATVASALTASGYDPAKAAKATTADATRHDNLVAALSSLDASEQNLTAGGGAQGPMGATANIPLLGQYINPSGAAYNKTKIETATQLAKAITNSARPGQQVTDAYLHSLPNTTDNPEFAKQKIAAIRNQLLTQAKSFKYQDIVDQNAGQGQAPQPSQGQPEPQVNTGNPVNNTIQNNPILKTILGYSANTAQDIGAGARSMGEQPSLNKNEQMASQLEQQAMSTKDMAKRKTLLQQANQIRTATGNEAGNIGQSFTGDVQQNPLVRALLTGGQIAGAATLPTDVAMLAKGGVNALLHPVQTVQGIGNVVKGVGAALNDPVGALQAAGLALKGDAANSFKLAQPKQTFQEALTAMQKPKAQIATTTTPSFINKAGSSIRQNVRQIDLPPSVYGHGQEQAVNKTLDTLGFQGDARQQYSMLQPKMDELGNQIQGVMAANPKTASIDTIIQDFDKNLTKQGIYRSGQISKDVAQKEVRSYVKDLYNSASGKEGEVVPTNINDTDLFNLKKAINQDYKGVAKKLQNSVPLTDREKVISVARQTVDDVLSSLHPQVKELTSMQSHLYDAADSLHTARGAKGPSMTILGTHLKIPARITQNIKDPLGRVLGR